jgi:hypothetical protein
MVYWFAATKEQYRISGTLELVFEDTDSPDMLQARAEQWKIMSPSAKQQFYTNKQPGQIIVNEQEAAQGEATEAAAAAAATTIAVIDETTPPPSTFVLMLLWPLQVKYLRLTDMYSQLDTYSAEDSTWKSVRVVS